VSPVARSSGHAGRALLVGTSAVIIVMVALFVAAVVFSGRDSGDVGLGDQTFQGGNAERLAAEIDDRGPIYYPDVSGRGMERPIILQHLGDDDSRRWYAFLAYPSDRNADCPWRWRPDDQRFEAACDSARTAPADGKGLERYPVTVLDGRLNVDLNFADRTTTTTAPPTTAPETGD